MSQVGPEQPADPFNTEGLVAPPREDPNIPSEGDPAQPAVSGLPTPAQAQVPDQTPQTPDAGMVQSMTNLLGVPDPIPSPAVPAVDTAAPPAQSAQPTSAAVDAQPAKATSAVGGAPPLPAPTQVQTPVGAEVKDTSGAAAVSPVPSQQPEGGATRIGGGQLLGQAGGAGQSPSIEDRPAAETSSKPDEPAAPTFDAPDDSEDPMTPPPRPGDPPLHSPPIPVPAQAAGKPSDAAEKGGKPAAESDKALQDDFAKHWQSGGGDKQDVQGEDGEKGGDKGKSADATDGRAGPTGAVTTTWTSPDGETHTGTETPRRAGGKASTSTSSSQTASSSSSKSEGTSTASKKAEETGRAPKQDDGLTDEQDKGEAAEDEKDDKPKDPPSPDEAPSPAPSDNTPTTTFPIDPSSSYTVVTGSVTLTGDAAVSAIKAGATPLDAQGGTETKEKDKDGGPGTVVIAGIVGGVVVVILLGCWVWYRIRKRKSSTRDNEKTSPTTPYPASPSRTPRGPRSGRRGNDTDWTDSGFDFIDDPVSATSTQIRNRRSTIANYYDRHGMPPPHPAYPGAGMHGGNPFDDMNAREYAQAYGAGMEVMYDEKAYDQHGQPLSRQYGVLHPANLPQVGQVWRTEDPFADQRRAQGQIHDQAEGEYRYDEEQRERGPSPLQDLPLSPPPHFASASPNAHRPDTGFTAPMTNPFGEPTPRRSHENHAQSGPGRMGYESRAGTQYDDTGTALYDPYARQETAGMPDNGGHSGGAYGLALETGLPAKTPATGSLLPWLGTSVDSRDGSEVPSVPASADAGVRLKSGKSKEGKHKKAKSKDKKRAKSSKHDPSLIAQGGDVGNGYNVNAHQTAHTFQRQDSYVNERRTYELIDPNAPQAQPDRYDGQDDPFDDMEQVPHPVRAAMAATPAVAKMQMTQRNMNEVPIPNFR